FLAGLGKADRADGQRGGGGGVVFGIPHLGEDDGARAGGGIDVEHGGQALYGAEARAGGSAGGIAVLHGAVDVIHAGAAIDGEDFAAERAVGFEGAKDDFAAAAVAGDVIAELGDDDGEASALGFVQADAFGDLCGAAARL